MTLILTIEPRDRDDREVLFRLPEETPGWVTFTTLPVDARRGLPFGVEHVVRTSWAPQGADERPLVHVPGFVDPEDGRHTVRVTIPLVPMGPGHVCEILVKAAPNVPRGLYSRKLRLRVNVAVNVEVTRAFVLFVKRRARRSDWESYVPGTGDPRRAERLAAAAASSSLAAEPLGRTA